MIERRTARLEVREEGTTGRRFWIRALPYGVVDTYRTMFAPGVMGDVLEDPPALLYGHDYMTLGNVLGRAIDVRDSDDALDILFELDDPADVPAARQAAAQLRSSTLRRFSVGFERIADETDETREDVTRITRARPIEVSIVLDPAVPGTGVLAMRATDGQRVTIELVREVAAYLRDGLVSREQAHQLLADNTVPAEQPPPPATPAGDIPAETTAEAAPADDPADPPAPDPGATEASEGEPATEPAPAAPEETAALADAEAALDLIRSR